MFAGKFSHTLRTFCFCTDKDCTHTYLTQKLLLPHCAWSLTLSVKLALPRGIEVAFGVSQGQSSLLKLGNGFQSFHVLWEINTLNFRYNSVWSHYIKENGTSLNWGLEDKICTANCNKPEFVLTACQVGTLISRQWPAVLLWFDASLHHHQSPNPHSYWPHSGFGTGRMTKAGGLNMEKRWVPILCFESLLQEYVEPLYIISPFLNRIN